MKKIIIGLIINLSSLAYPSSVSLDLDKDPWKKIEDYRDQDNCYEIKWTQANSMEELTLSFRNFIHEPKKSSSRIDLSHLIFPDNTSPSALDKMRDEYRYAKNNQSPYSYWKLIKVLNINDIIYECRTPDLGPYTHSYTLTRLIKTNRGYMKISYHSTLLKDKHSTDEWITKLETFVIS